MGTSLGLGQGMEYQFVDSPQPSQPLPILRQARLAQLREERMRRHTAADVPDMGDGRTTRDDGGRVCGTTSSTGITGTSAVFTNVTSATKRGNARSPTSQTVQSKGRGDGGRCEEAKCG